MSVTAYDPVRLREQWAERLRESPTEATIEYHGGGRMVIVSLGSNGSLLVRKHGGRHTHLGRLISFESESVPAWRATIAPERHAIMIARLNDAGFPVAGAEHNFVPDEHYSSVGIHHREGTSAEARAGMSALSAAISANPRLAYVVRELDGLAYTVMEFPPTELLPNPELDQWRPVSDEQAATKASPLARLEHVFSPSRSFHDERHGTPNADEYSRARIQTAIALFYKARVETPIPGRAPAEEVVTLPDANVTTPPPPQAVEIPHVEAPPIIGEDISHAFLCDQTGLVAGTLTLLASHPPSKSVWLALSGFAPTGDAKWNIAPEHVERLRDALTSRNARALWQHDHEIVPFFCSACGLCFAASRWQLDRPSAWSVDGVCPAGHRQRLCSQ